MGTSGLGMVHKLYDIYLYLVTSINVFCALGLCFRVLLLKILQTKRFSCGEILLKTHKQRLQKKKKQKNTGCYIPDYPPFQQFYHGNEWTW